MKVSVDQGKDVGTGMLEQVIRFRSRGTEEEREDRFTYCLNEM